ncbi:MAG: DUF6297 family protein [Arachnia sp.]
MADEAGLSQAEIDADPIPAAQEPVAPKDPEVDHFAVVGEADETQLKLLMRDWRQGRANRNLMQALQDAYVMVFAVVVIGAMMVNSIIQAQRNVAGCETDQCLAARGLLPWAAVAGLLAFTLVAARMFGPIIASAAEGFWLMDAPVDRRRLLAGRFLGSLGVAFGAGALFGALVAALTGSNLLHIVIWTLAAGLGAFGLTAFAAAEQALERTWILRVVQWVAGLVAVLTMGALVAIAAGWIPLDALDALSTDFATLVGITGLLLGLISSIIAFARLRRIRRQRLTSGSALLAGVQGAAFAMDFALVRDILLEHEARERGHVRATRGSGHGTRALILRDVQRLWRYPRPLVFWLASMVVPYAVQALDIDALNPPLSALVLMAALVGFFNSLRVLTRTKGLQRAFPFSPSEIKTAVMVVPGALALIWAVATAPAFLGIFTTRVDTFTGISAAFITAFAGFLGAVRWVSARPADYSGPMVAVGIGAMPPGMMFSALRGIDMVALVTLPIVFGLPPWVSLVIGVIAFGILRSGMDRDTLMEQSEEQRKELERARAQSQGGGGTKEKIKVQRRS